MMTLMLILILAGGDTQTLPIDGRYATTEQCREAGSAWLMEPAANGIVIGFACQTVKEEG